MSKFLCAEIYVDNTSITFDKTYDYVIPQNMSDKIFVGQRVLIPFGRINKKRVGYVRKIKSCLEAQVNKLKPISSIVDTFPCLSDEMIGLADYMADRAFCTFSDAVKPMLPPGIGIKLYAEYSIGENVDFSSLSDDEMLIIKMLNASDEPLKAEYLLSNCGLNHDSDILEKLTKSGHITKRDEFRRVIGDATVKMIRLCEDYDSEQSGIALSAKRKSVADFLLQCGTATVKEVCYFTGVTQSVLDGLVRLNIAEYFEDEVYRNPYEYNGNGNRTPIELNCEQQAAYDGLEKTIGPALLFGVTGSGKTQVFLKLIDKTLESGRSVIVMVPEIALTPQTISIFQNRYGNRVAVLHSAMSVGQRTDEWKRIKNHDVDIAVGTRSAIFAPFDNLGLIVMDEEHEHTYKSEGTPRYHARDMAIYRAKYNNCLFCMASATPSVGTFCKAKSGKIPMFTLKNRYGNVNLPVVQIVNMRENYKKGEFSSFSPQLKEVLVDRFSKNKQSILLLNRRGYRAFVSCSSCGTVSTCPNCSISLTYHNANNRLMCHYCGYSEGYSGKCKHCGNDNIKLMGYGTQAAQEELAQLLPDARILRMDADTTMARFSHEKKLGAFARHEYDIMIGTQMVAKGLNFPDVTLVGVINADQSLYSGDYKSSENTFSLLTQVIGRSGRGSEPGIAVIQTISPDSEIVRLSAQQDYEAFYETEILSRKYLIYPPYCDLAVIGFSGADRDKVSAVSKCFFDKLVAAIESEYNDQKIIILGPSVCAVPKISGKYRYRIIIKCKNSKRFRAMIRELLISSMKSGKYKEVSVFADINPESII